MRDRSSRKSWNGPTGSLLLVPLLAWGLALPCLAGDSFLDRNSKVQEAVPYGTTIETPTSRKGGEPSDEHEEDGPSRARSRGGAPSTAADPEEGPRGDGGGTDGPR